MCAKTVHVVSVGASFVVDLSGSGGRRRIKGLTRLGWHTLLRPAALSGLSTFSSLWLLACMLVSGYVADANIWSIENVRY